VFFLAVVDSCPHLPNVRIDLRQVDWSSIPYVVARAENVISYYNRRLLSDITTPVKIWGNFCCYRGYALIGRKDKFSMPLPDLESANQALDLLSEAAPLKIITMGSDTISVLKTVLTPLLNSKRVLTESHPPDHALERFLGGRGDLFIGGLPQRLACARNGDTVEVITSDTNPLWFGIDAMIYKGDLVEEEVLLQIANLFVETRTIAGKDYRPTWA
jgi:hypothetical protein